MVTILVNVVKRRVCEQKWSALECKLAAMKKEDRIGVRVSVELKKALTQISKNEDRTLAQVCEIFLRDAVLSYKEDGPKFFQRLVARLKKDD
jgi:hypothetical protein